MAAGGIDDREDRLGDVRRLFVFPEPENCPAARNEKFGHLGISLSVAVDLLKPEFFVLLYHWWVDRAAVPEATVEKNRDFKAW